MSSTPLASIRQHRLLAGAAVLHAVAITASLSLMYSTGFQSDGEQRLWVGFATLWLLWPLVLILHRGRSTPRVVLALFVSLVVLLPAQMEYRFAALRSFGWPEGVPLSVRALREYHAARGAGEADAEADLRMGKLAFEIYGMPPTAIYRQIVQRYGIDLRQTAGCTDVTAAVLGHGEGYNKVAEPEIKRRFGNTFFEDVQEESLRAAQASN